MGNGVKQKQKEMNVKSGLNKQNEGSAQDHHCYQRGGPKYNSELQPQHKKEGNTVDKNTVIKSRVNVMKQQQQKITKLHIKLVIVASGSCFSTNYAMMNTCQTSSL